jgi:histidinol-phosphate phosphatase family protein
MSAPDTTLVIPTLGRPSLVVLLRVLAAQTVPLRAPVVVVDDRRSGADLSEILGRELGHDHGLELNVVRAGGGGPARARNLGWRQARTTWVSFLDDDVVPLDSWYADLGTDLEAADSAAAAGSAGRVRVPLPADRAPTDWERGTAGLETARWITADLTYRRSELSSVGGFDERFPRAFREDADLALRLGAERGRVVDGTRRVTHPVRPAGDWASLRQQAGNADDFLMRSLHGRHWHRRAEAPVGRRARNAAITALGLMALGAAATRRRRLAVGAGVAWAAGSLELAWARVAPGPRDREEVRRMLLTSVAIPPAATFHSLRGLARHRGARPWRGLPDLVLLDRDGTLVEDVPYNGDPTLVRPLPGAAAALSRLRALGVRTALVTNQSAIASGSISRAQADAVNARVNQLLGPFDAIYLCPHAATDGCDCRKPEPGMVKQACSDLGVDPLRTVLIGDIGSDVEAAEAAGAVGILVPTDATLGTEIAAAGVVALSLDEAVDRILAGAW